MLKDIYIENGVGCVGQGQGQGQNWTYTLKMV